MKKNQETTKVIPWLIILYTWPIFAAWVTLFARNWFMLPIMAITGVLFVPEYFRSKIFIRSLLFFFVLSFYFLLWSRGYDSIVGLFCDICLFTAIAAFAYFFSNYADDSHIKIIFFSTIGFVILTTVASFIICQSFPNIIRYSGSGGQDNLYITLVNSLQRYGLSSFDIVHALPILIPSLILGFKSQSLALWERCFFLIMALLCVFQTYVSGSATPLFLAILVLIASFVLHVGRFRSNIAIFVVFTILCFVLLSPTVLSTILSSFSSILGADSTELQARIADVDEAISTGNADSGDMGLRIIQYQLSIDAFFNNIFFGSSDMPLGGHSFVLDTLGGYGLVGFFALSSFVIALLKYIMKHISPSLVSFYGLSIVAAVVMLASKNTGTWATWCFLFIISPVIIKSIGSISNSKA